MNQVLVLSIGCAFEEPTPLKEYNLYLRSASTDDRMD